MDQSRDIKIEKLSSTIEELGLDRRTYHILKRARFRFVCDIITRGEKAILDLNNIGPVIANKIFSALANHLNVTPEDLFDENIYQVALLEQGKPTNPLNASITLLDLSPMTTYALAELGVYQVGDLLDIIVKSNGEIVREFGEFNYIQLRRIYRKLNSYLKKTNWVADRTLIVKETETQLVSVSKPVIRPSNIDVSILLKMILRNERTSQIIELRAIQLLTLEEIAAKAGGVTRERVRQIINDVHERIQKNLLLLMSTYDFLEKSLKRFRKKLENNSLSLRTLIDQFKQELPNSNIIATDEELETLISILRLLAIHDKPWAHDVLNKRWKDLTFLACFVNPPTEKYEEVDRLIRRNKEKNRKMGYKEIAHLVLLDAKEPLHWSEIADRAYHIGRRDSFNTTALYNTLMRLPSVFVRVDSGTYALVEWGFSQADYYPNIIASILKSSKKPLSYDAIYHKVNEIRQVKQSTLLMSLDMHPRFYRSLEKNYGLRAWLPSREKQTLRTPEWLVEDSDSYKRLEQASQRGYDIESMIQEDLVNT